MDTTTVNGEESPQENNAQVDNLDTTTISAKTTPEQVAQDPAPRTAQPVYITPEPVTDTSQEPEDPKNNTPSTGEKIANQVRKWILRIILLALILCAIFAVIVKYRALPPIWWDNVNTHIISVIDNTEEFLQLERPQPDPLTPVPDIAAHNNKQDKALQQKIDKVATEVERKSQLDTIEHQKNALESLLDDLERQEDMLKK